VSCYTRHLGDLLAACGYDDTKEHRKLLDKAIRSVLQAENLGCPEVWKLVKARKDTPEFIQAVSEALSESAR
jgi:hypothetical protein